MDAVVKVFQAILGLGPIVVLPIAFFILGAIFGADPRTNFRAALTIGIAFVGLFMVIGFMIDTLGPVAKAFTERLGLQLNTLDVGCMAVSGASWAWAAAAVMIPIGLLINFIMLALGWVKTLDVDIWNYWHFAFTGALVAVATNNVILGIIAGAIWFPIVFKLGDIVAPYVQDRLGIPTVTTPHFTTVAYVPIVLAAKAIIDRIPFLGKIKADPAAIQEKIGIFGENRVIGFIIGLLFAIVSGKDLPGILLFSVQMGALLLLLPTMLKFLMEGMVPLSEAARDFMAKRFAGREIYIGLDWAILAGDAAVLTVGLLNIPTILILAAILPGNTVLPFGDLVFLAVPTAMAVCWFKGDIVKAWLAGLPCLALTLWMTSYLAPPLTAAIQAIPGSGIEMIKGVQYLGCIEQGSWFSALSYAIFSLFGS